MVCNKQLSTGEELYVIDENKFVCKEDYSTSGAIKEVNLNSGNQRDDATFCVYLYACACASACVSILYKCTWGTKAGRRCVASMVPSGFVGTFPAVRGDLFAFTTTLSDEWFQCLPPGDNGSLLLFAATRRDERWPPCVQKPITPPRPFTCTLTLFLWRKYVRIIFMHYVFA